MYEVQFSIAEDKEQLHNLYNICFADDHEFSEWYFENIWDYSKTLVMKSEGKIVSSLQMLPLNFSNGINTVNGCYIFAVCTHPEYRGQGYAGSIINECFDICRENKNDFCALIVRESSLLNFYEKLGFRSVFDVTQTNGKSSVGYVDILSFSDIPDIDRIYKAHTNNFFSSVRDSEFWQTQMCVYKVFGLKENGKLISYCFGDVRDNAFYSVEALGEKVDKLCSYAAFHEGTEEYTMLTVPGHKSKTIGCIKNISKESDLLFNDSAKGYLNLYFN